MGFFSNPSKDYVKQYLASMVQKKEENQQSITFIQGMPRSSSSAFANVINASSSVHSYTPEPNGGGLSIQAPTIIPQTDNIVEQNIKQKARGAHMLYKVMSSATSSEEERPFIVGDNIIIVTRDPLNQLYSHAKQSIEYPDPIIAQPPSKDTDPYQLKIEPHKVQGLGNDAYELGLKYFNRNLDLYQKLIKAYPDKRLIVLDSDLLKSNPMYFLKKIEQITTRDGTEVGKIIASENMIKDWGGKGIAGEDDQWSEKVRRTNQLHAPDKTTHELASYSRDNQKVITEQMLPSYIHALASPHNLTPDTAADLEEMMHADTEVEGMEFYQTHGPTLYAAASVMRVEGEEKKAVAKLKEEIKEANPQHRRILNEIDKLALKEISSVNINTDRGEKGMKK